MSTRTGRFLFPLAAVVLSLAGCGAPPDPLIFQDFETDAELDRIAWMCHYDFRLTSDHVVHGEWALRADLPAGEYPSIIFRDVPRDWRPYRELSFSAFLAGDEPRVGVLRIDDGDSGDDLGLRANLRVDLAPGPNRVKFPIDQIKTDPEKRNLHINDIRRMILFLLNTERREVLVLDDFRLEGAR